jgi:sugar phosphate isomerase/epimerase
MSTSVEQAVAACRPAEIEPVELSAESLDTTAPGYLRELKRELSNEGYQPAQLSVEARFEEDCSLATQEEADRLRAFVRAASFLGAGSLTVTVDEVGDAEKVRPALSALAERAHREGVTLTVEGLDVQA